MRPLGPSNSPAQPLGSGEAARAPPLPVLRPPTPTPSPAAPVSLRAWEPVSAAARVSEMNEKMNGWLTALFNSRHALGSVIHSFVQASTRGY